MLKAKPSPYVYSARCFLAKSAILDGHSLVQRVKKSTVLTTYNGSCISTGSINIQCTDKGERKTLVVTEGPTTLGLPSLRDLEIVTMHCIMQDNQAQINSVKDLRNMYSDQFNRISSFASEYHIVQQLSCHSCI